MAAKQIVSDGIGFNAGVVGYLLTQGFGFAGGGGGGGGVSWWKRRRRRGFIVLGLLCLLVI